MGKFVLKASDETFEEYNEILTVLAALKNKHMFFEYKDLPDVEVRAEITRLQTLLEEMSH